MQNTLKKAIPLLFLSILLVALLTWFSLQYIVEVRGLKFDFYPRWAGAQAFWQGQSPYTAEVTEQIQRGMFGNVLAPEYDQQKSAYPAYNYILLAPIIIWPAPIAIALWMSIQLLALLCSIMLWFHILDWHPPVWLVGILALGCLLLFRHPINTFVLAQFTGTILLLNILAAKLLLDRHDILAGILLACSTIPPTIAAPLALAILLAYALRGRWQGLAAFLVSLTLLTLLSILRIGWWIGDFIRNLNEYSEYSHPIWVPGLFPNTLFSGLFIILVGGIVGLAIWNYWKSQEKRQQIDMILIIMIACLLLLPQTGSYYMVLLIPPILTILYRSKDSPAKWAIRLATLLALVSPWFYDRVLQAGMEIEALFLPLHVLILWIIVNYRTWFKPSPQIGNLEHAPR